MGATGSSSVIASAEASSLAGFLFCDTSAATKDPQGCVASFVSAAPELGLGPCVVSRHRSTQAENEDRPRAASCCRGDAIAGDGALARELPGPGRSLADVVKLPPFGLASAVALLLPGATAAHAGLAAPGVAAACLPIMVPFSVPSVSPEAWLSNKRARACHRACVICVYVQGAFAGYRFLQGDLVGGTYAALQALMGVYATDVTGLRFFPTYIVVSGFNGLLGLFQVFQTFNGVPLHILPLAALLPHLASLAGAYFGWQFCQEVTAIAGGLGSSGSQDTCFVRVMASDCWPLSALSPNMAPADRISGFGNIGGGDSGSGGLGWGSGGFNAFGGGGHRLGSQ